VKIFSAFAQEVLAPGEFAAASSTHGTAGHGGQRCGGLQRPLWLRGHGMGTWDDTGGWDDTGRSKTVVSFLGRSMGMINQKKKDKQLIFMMISCY
jgi:hypothetical protein